MVRLLSVLLLTVATAVGLSPVEAAAAPRVYWGTDTNTAAKGNGFPQDFYIGRLGGELSQICSNFNAAAARAAGNDRTYMYWDLAGAGTRSNADAYAFGRAQAKAAVQAWHNGCNSQYVSGLTVFADMEGGNPGWSGRQSANRRVVDGWLNYFATYVPVRSARLRGGLYVGPDFWSQQIGNGFRASRPFVLWIWGCQTDTKTQAQVPATLRMLERNTLGGSKVALWQWSTQGHDFDATSENPNNFRAIPGATTYVCSGCGAGSGCP